MKNIREQTLKFIVLFILFNSCDRIDYQTKLFQPLKVEVHPKDLIANGFEKVHGVDVSIYSKSRNDTTWLYTFTSKAKGGLHSNSWVIPVEDNDSLFLSNFFMDYQLPFYELKSLLNYNSDGLKKIYVKKRDVNQIFELQRDSNKLWIHYDYRFD